jgi:hypothetical protein
MSPLEGFFEGEPYDHHTLRWESDLRRAIKGKEAFRRARLLSLARFDGAGGVMALMGAKRVTELEWWVKTLSGATAALTRSAKLDGVDFKDAEMRVYPIEYKRAVIDIVWWKSTITATELEGHIRDLRRYVNSLDGNLE